ncbi:SMI1/KNR4 family protein [Streptomyces sp. fd1-xmd]|uniref:SMI1/KNR4 family protein n=1 Tax=Streptomyces sp. fd1-xmd TaxID=1812480 RepID=UPI001C2013A6|nr:SMI1/KNR4 family protein [Streptomyces sp. fd1-xmd]
MTGRLRLPWRRRTGRRAGSATPPGSAPPLSEAEVAEAERELGVRFPPGYRTYLREESAGGGHVRRLRRGPEGWWWDANHETRRDLLPVPFPHPDSYAAEDDEQWARQPQSADFADDLAYAEAWARWDDEGEEREDRKTAGAVVLQENGCGFRTLLVITGPLADTVWWDGRATCDRIVPLSFDHPGGAPPLTFREWRERGLTDPSHLLGPDWGRPAPR